jgi:hypothetical protein
VLFGDRLPTSVFGFCVYVFVRINHSSSVEQTVTRSTSSLHTVLQSQLQNRTLATRSVSWRMYTTLNLFCYKEKIVVSCTDDIDTPESFGNRLKDFYRTLYNRAPI